ncbi:hypothetical protein [Sphingomonas mesophila]|uniref:hypothetical protein n=1 Tax=Sphingomonas mesophila TaxID=2303576 RepID=UPI000E579AB7|nr:hypothetical protein [Sphingomonas mesophila]
MAKLVILTALLGAAAQPAAAQYSAPPYGQGWGPNQPIVRVNQYDGGTVNLRNGCVVAFNSYGRALSRSPRCTPLMVDAARDLFRRNQMGQAYRPSGGAWGPPRVAWWGNSVRVDFPGIACSYVYSRNGELLQTLGDRCTAQTRGIANEAQTAFRRGWRG